MPKFRSISQTFLLLLALAFAAEAQDAAAPVGVAVRYQLPDTPGKTYRVTLAIVDKNDPNWIISTFVAGAARSVTAENKGVFSENWDGLDENFMPVPAGSYGVKGIFMAAQKWAIDGEYHTLTPKLASVAGSWGQTPAQDKLPPKISGDPVGSPFYDVDVAPGGKGVLLFQYLENSQNNYLTDFSKPINYEQILASYPSGGAAGGQATCTDGTTIWSFSTDGGQKFIYRADGKAFGKQNGRFRRGVYLPEGWVSGLAAWRVKERTVVFAAERGRSVTDAKDERRVSESPTDFVNKIVALDGETAEKLGEWTVEKPQGIAESGGKLTVLHRAGENWAVSRLDLSGDWTNAKLQPLFNVPQGVEPFDLEVDGHDRIYLSDPKSNHVFQFDAKGKRLLTFGRADAQKSRQYDPQALISPQKLATWTDENGQDRLLIVEAAGPNRLSEWSSDGKLGREWVVPQLRANYGYWADPRQPDRIYMPGQKGWLVRWRVNYQSGEWTTDAVWPNVGTGAFARQSELPRLIYHGDDKYLAFGRNYAIYKLEGDKWRASAAILTEKDAQNRPIRFVWRDENGDGEVQETEKAPLNAPKGTLRYWGESWMDDFSLVAIGNGTPDIWRLAPTGFDAKGNPIFAPDGWKKLLSDPIFVARQAGKAEATRGGNEAANAFDSSWAMVAGAPDGGYYVNARGGAGASSNYGAQNKLSRYIPDGKGGQKLLWRVGREALQGNARPGEIYGSIFVSSPINGLVGIIDNTRAGALVYNEDGLYVDTLLADIRILSREQVGSYQNPGEFFAGQAYLNRDNGRVYLAMGKATPVIYEIQGWTDKANPVQKLTIPSPTVTIAANRIAAAPDFAIRLRGGSAGAKLATFYPAPGGGPALDGSLTGWEGVEPISFSPGEGQSVEVRPLYDPDTLFLRWHVRLGQKFEAKPLNPPERIFTHDRAADTVGFYFQADPNAPPSDKNLNGRAGDVRFEFGLFQDGANLRAAVLGLFPGWTGKGKASPITYTSPVGKVPFEHVGLLPDAKTGFQMDADGKGYVLAAAMPRSNWHALGRERASICC